MSNYEDKYIGPKKVKFTTEDGETRGGVKLVRVTYDDNTSEVFSELNLESEGVVTNGPSDLTTLRGSRLFPIVGKILELCRDYNVKTNEVQFLTQLVVTSINKNIDDANKHLWNCEDTSALTLPQIDVVLATVQPKPTTLKDVLGAQE